MDSTTLQHLTRSNLWSTELKENFEDELMALKYIDWLDGFPDGEQFNIPSVGQAEAMDYEEGQSVTYTDLATGNFTFRITEYVQSGHFITKKALQDGFYMSQLVSKFVPSEHRAIMKVMEKDALRIGVERQTASDPNTIAGVSHRWVGTGVDGASASNDTISVEDFARARLALQKANVPLVGLIAIVDPSVEFTFNTLANITNVSNNPMWQGIISEGIGDTTGMKFKANVYGFDVYTSQNLATVSDTTIHSHTVPTNNVANLFFSTAPEAAPFVGAVRQPPTVDSKWNMDLQREEYVTTARYGLDLYRPENFVVVITDNTIAVPTYA
jgi:hypothetical protein